MKSLKPIILLSLLLIQLSLMAQAQWYQNQDGNNPPPYGTVATKVLPFTSNTFIACYLWSSNNEQYTWKISKSNINGTEQKTFFSTATSSSLECKAGRNNTLYVFERSFTADYTPRFIVYKLDANLQINRLKEIYFPNGFIINNISAFELDNNGSVYFAGDGLYPNSAGGNSPASFIVKANHNLENQWSKIDSTETSYSRLHIDRWGRVLVIEDYYTFFPQVRIKRFSANGQPLSTFMVNTDAGRYSLTTTLDTDDNIIMYGGKTVGESSQAMFLKRISRVTGNTVYSKTHFTASLSQLTDLQVDRNGDIYTVVTQQSGPADKQCKISRINLFTGNISWNHVLRFSSDSCNLIRLVLNGNERFYVLGEKRSGNYFSKGFAMRLKKNGQPDGRYYSPDSVAFQRSHWLTDGITDNNNRLIVIGSTADLDTVTGGNSYFRSFAMRMGATTITCNNRRGGEEAIGEEENFTDAAQEEKVELTTRLVVYPNPVQNQLNIFNIKPEEYDRAVIYNMQGAILLQNTINTTTARIDISNLSDGVYLFVLRSSIALKEKSIKFVVRK